MATTSWLSSDHPLEDVCQFFKMLKYENMWILELKTPMTIPYNFILVAISMNLVAR